MDKPIPEGVERARQCIVMLRQHLALFVQDAVAQAMFRDADEVVAALTAAQQQGQAVACDRCGDSKQEFNWNGDGPYPCRHCHTPQPMQQGGGDVCRHEWITTGGGDGGPRRSLRCSNCHVHRDHTAPPSAPVGVEDWQKQVRRIARYTGVQYGATEKCELGAPFYAFTPAELHLFAERIAALAQQPAAVDEARAMELWDEFREAGHHERDALICVLQSLATQHQEPTT